MEYESSNFIEDIVIDGLEKGYYDAPYTRFPPEPNGYLHIGHAKSLNINFGVKQKFNGKCNLRFDDTNPTKEDVEYVDSIKEDIKWLGYNWDKELYASDYFEQIFEYAVLLIKKGLAFVCDYNAEQIRETRGSLTEPGQNSPYRNRTVEENLQLFYEMRDGKYADGEKVLRAKIDMASPNMNMRDPVIYRILRAHHHRTGDKWLVYPMYDFAHPLSDAIEGITHSICTLEFEDHRPLYDWVVDNCDFEKKPHQYEFARLNIKRTIMSKRYLKRLVDEGKVDGWSDPRMPTLSGMRRRGYPAEAIKDFCNRVGVAKANSEVENALFEHCVREYLNNNAYRLMVVEKPLRVIIDNMGEDEVASFEVENFPSHPEKGSHTITLSKEIYIDSDDFSLNPPPKYKRLTVGGMIRLRGAYILTYNSVELDEKGQPIAVHCNYIEDSQSGGNNAGIKVKGVVQWVDAKNCADVTINKYDYLLLPEEEGVTDFADRMNKDSLIVVENAKAEKYLVDGFKEGESFQAMRVGYFKLAKSQGNTALLYDIVSLKDSFNK